MKKFNGELGKMVYVVIPMILQPLLTFAFLLLVARSSAIESYGALALSIVLASVVITFSDVGLRDYLLSRNAINKGISRGENLFFPSSLGYLTLAAAALIYAHLIAETDLAFWLLVASLPEAFALGVLHKSLFFDYQKHDQLVRFSSLDAFNKSAPFVIKIVAFWLLRDIVLAVALGAITALLTYSVWFFLRCVRTRSFFTGEAGPVESVRDMFSFWRAWSPFTISFLAFFLYFGCDRIIIEALLGSEPLAVYAAAYSFIAIGQIVVTAFWSLYMPRVSRGDDVFSQRRFLGLAVLLSLAMFAGYQLFAVYIFEYLYPQSFADATLIMSIMSGFFIFRLINVVFEMHWVAKEKYDSFVKRRVLCGIISVALNLSFIPFAGLLVPAVVVVFCELLLTVMILQKERHWRAARLLPDAPVSP